MMAPPLLKQLPLLFTPVFPEKVFAGRSVRNVALLLDDSMFTAAPRCDALVCCEAGLWQCGRGERVGLA
jgi:hypothetical protein